MKIVSYILLLIIFSSCVRYETVSYITDGDTFVTYSGEKIRLSNVDAPEAKQFYGLEAKQFLSKLIMNKRVRLVTHGKDKYGRTIADVYVGSVYVNELEVKNGIAWAYKRYATSKFHNEQLTAKRNKVGLWAYNDQIPPFLYRNQSK